MVGVLMTPKRKLRPSCSSPALRPLVCPGCGKLLLREACTGAVETKCPRCKALVRMQREPGCQRRVSVLQ